jgi:hypothetical protein
MQQANESSTVPQRRLPDRPQPVVGGVEILDPVLDCLGYWQFDRAVSSVIFLLKEINDLRGGYIQRLTRMA